MSDQSASIRNVLTTIHGNARGYLRCFAGKRGPDGKIARDTVEEVFFAYPAVVDNAIGWLQRRSMAGKEVYVGVCLFSEQRAAKAFALPVKFLWIDGDASPIPTTRIVPAITIASSPGRWQGYVRLTHRIPAPDAESFSRRYAYAIGGDRSGWDCTQLLRVIETPNYKYDGAPLVKLLGIRNGVAYDPDDLDRLLPEVATVPMPDRPPATVAGDPSDEPPVALSERGTRLWTGDLRITKRDGTGEVDRSATMHALACEMWDANATQTAIVAALHSRDVAWDWGYADEKRGDFERLTAKIAATKPRKVGPIAGVETGAPCGADHAQLQREIARLTETVASLQVRCRLADEKLAAYQNRNLGTAGAVAAELIQIFASETPTRPDEPACYRMPLDKLARLTGFSPDTCSRHLKQLASFTLPDGETPLIHREVLDIPGGVDIDTGEIVTPRKEVWIGPGVPVAEFAHTVATLDPAEKKAWGGKRDDGVCADHPDVGVIERVAYLKRVTWECAVCNEVLDARTVVIAGKTQSVRLLRHIPTTQDAGWLVTHDDEGGDVDDAPIPQDAGTLTPQARGDGHLSGKLRHREPLGFTQTSLASPAFDEMAAALAAWDRRSPSPPDRYTDGKGAN